MLARLEDLARSVPLAIAVLGVALLIGALGASRKAAAQGTAPRYDAPSDSTPADDRPRPKYRYDEPAPTVPPKSADLDSFPLREPVGGTPADTPTDTPQGSPPGDLTPPAGPAPPSSTLPAAEIQLDPPALPSGAPSAADTEYGDLIDKLAVPSEDEPADVVAPQSLGDLHLALRDVLRERETELRDQYVAGTASLTELLAASEEVFQVELALVGTQAERIGLLGQYLESLDKFEAKAEPLVRAGSIRVTRADYMALKAIQLRAKIALAQEQGGTLGGVGNSPAGGRIGAARDEFRLRKAQYEAGTANAQSLAKAGMVLSRLLADQAEAAGEFGQALQHSHHARVFAARNHEAIQAAYIAAQVSLASVDEAETHLADCMDKIEQLQRLAGRSPGR